MIMHRMTPRMLAGFLAVVCLALTGFLAVVCLAPLQSPLLPIWGQAPPSSIVGDGRGVSAQPGQADPAKDIVKLKEEVRQLKAQLEDLRIQNKAIESHLTFGPEVEAQNEDYAQARSRFQTKLLRRGPSPQPGSPVKPPAGVTEIEYPSGELRLKRG